MKRKDKPRKQKRPNPAAGLPGIEQMLSNAVGPMVKRHTMRRLESFIDAIVGKRLTYAALIAKVSA